MLIDNILNTHFLGNDGFRWFIGQVTPDPNWREFSIKYGYRAKVRIFGFHPSDSSVKDEELPWAHFLVPPNLGAGNNYGGASFALQGGETVLGFFLDGADAQQPIIMGSLFASHTIQDVALFNDVIKKGTSEFKPIGPNPKLKYGKHVTTGGTEQPPTNGIPTPNRTLLKPSEDDPEKDEELSTQQLRVDEDEVRLAAVPKCDRGDGVMSNLVKTLRSFIKTARELKKYKEGYLDPVLNEISSLPALVGQVGDIISSLFSKVIKEVRKYILGEIYDKFAKLVNMFVPDSLIKEIALFKATDALYCVFEKVLKGLTGIVEEFLFGMVGKIITMPLCAAEQFIGGLISNVAGQLQDAVSEALKGIQPIIGGINTVMYYFNKVLGFAKKALNFLSCEGDNCEDNVYDWVANFGPVPQDIIDFQRSIDLSAKLDGLAGQAEGIVSGWFGGDDDEVEGLFGDKLTRAEAAARAEALIGPCDPFTFECGPPTVEFFGGGGAGALGSTVVNSFGEIVGVDMQDFGIGYTKAPFVAFIDACENGRGALGRAIMQDGKVTGVRMLSTGGNYLAPVITAENTGKEVTGFLTGVNVVNTGANYQEGDLIESDCGTFRPVLDDEGRIVGADLISNKAGCDRFPELTINTTSGFGAVLEPVLEFRDVGDIDVDPTKTIAVIDCVSAYKK